MQVKYISKEDCDLISFSAASKYKLLFFAILETFLCKVNILMHMLLKHDI